MPRLPNLTGKEIITILGKLGFEIVRTKGSHHILHHHDGRRTVVPVHAGETIGRGLMAKILHDCELDRDEFLALLSD
jgi:predicted RNA binding protein YcfA (HicA-like mRNA interferase family)